MTEKTIRIEPRIKKQCTIQIVTDPVTMYNALQDVTISKKLFDLRDEESFKQSKIITSTHLNLGDQNEEMTIGTLPKVLNLRGMLFRDVYFITDNVTQKLRQMSTLLCDEDKLENVYIFTGFDIFHEKYPFLTVEAGVVPPIKNYPNEILPSVFLGTAQQAKDKELLEKLGIKYVVNVAGEIAHERIQGINYLEINLDDVASAKIYIEEHVKNAFNYIDNAIKNGDGAVIVHCALGISRSASTVIYYLMRKWVKSFDEVHQYVRVRRPVIKPNEGFVEKLRELEVEVLECK